MNPITKAVTYWKLFKAGYRLVRNPAALGEVFDIADTLYEQQKPMVQAMVDELKTHQQGRRALELKPRVGRVTVPQLLAMPAGTLGRAFGDFLHTRGLDPSALPHRAAVDDTSFLHAHLYETHDLWHVVTGFETDVAGELGLQAFYGAQLCGRLPSALLAIGFVNTFLFAHHDRGRRLDAISKGWMLGKSVKPLSGYDWAASFSRPLAEVQAELGFTVPAVQALAA